MILVVGGMAQGKRKFAEGMFADRAIAGSAFSENSGGGEAKASWDWADGAKASLEEFGASPHGYHFHLLIRRLLEGDPSLLADSGWHGPAEDLPQRMAEFLLGTCRDRILVTEEIGSGIIPLDPLERRYRETAGRVCCRLAQDADQVWRVCCGIGRRIK